MSCRNNFFTLVELLVVIAVIAILAALLLQAVATAKSYSQGTACRSNLRQTGLAFSVYLSSYGHEMPAYIYRNASNTGNLWNCGYQTAALKENMTCSETAKSKIFQCPGMKAKKYDHCYKIGYCWFYGKLELAVSRPSDKVYATDGINEILHGQQLGENTAIYSYGYIPGAGRYGVKWVGYEGSTNNQMDFYEGRHALTNNLLFYDTHIEQRSALTVSMEYHSPARKVDKNGQHVTSDNDAYDNFFRPQNE